MKRKLQRKRARQRRRDTPARIMAKYAVELAAFRMGLVVWNDTLMSYFIGDRDVTYAMERLTFDAKVLGAWRRGIGEGRST